MLGCVAGGVAYARPNPAMKLTATATSFGDAAFSASFLSLGSNLCLGGRS